MRKIGTLPTSGRETIVFYHDEKNKSNPFTVKLEWREMKYCKDGTPKGVSKSSKTLEKYADFHSCMYCVMRMNQESNFRLFDIG